MLGERVTGYSLGCEAWVKPASMCSKSCADVKCDGNRARLAHAEIVYSIAIPMQVGICSKMPEPPQASQRFLVEAQPT